MNASIENWSRRDLLKIGALLGGGLVLGIFPRRALAQDPSVPASDSAAFAPNAFVRVGTDGQVTVVANHSEMGQGPYTSIAMIVADELDADWKRVRVEAAPVDPVYNHPVFGAQATGGSTTTWVEFGRLRSAGAAARMMLVQAAAETWGVPPTECKAESGTVVHGEKRLSYGELAEKAAKLAPPAEPTVKDPKDWKIIGRPTPRLDTPDKTTGKAVFGIDVSLPGMLVAVVARPPVFGARLKSVRSDKAKAVPGVRHVFEIDRGVGVVADGFYAAKLGREALELVWDEGPLATLDSKTEAAEFVELAKKPGKVALKEGDALAAIDAAAKKVEAYYELPYLAHSPMEPLNAVADVREGSAEVWVGTQYQTVDRAVAAAVAGLPPEKVKLHTTYLGGGFGRRGVFDGHFVAEAVALSKLAKAPVKVVWTREDDIRGGYYRPRASHALRAGLDSSGALVGWHHRLVCQSFLLGSPIEKFVYKDGVDKSATEGADDTHYAFPAVQVEWVMAPSGVPCNFWRSVGHSHTAFAVESFIDEVAHAAGKDPVEMRRSLLEKEPRMKRLLDIVAEKAGWGSALPAGRGRGVAIHESFGSLAAHVVEASVGKAGRPRVHRVTTAVDCGPVVNPDTVKAQVQSAIVFGLTAALHGEITFEKGRVQQRNFHDYPMLRMHEMPVVEVHVCPSGDKMGGVGEPAVPPIAPALANALFAATGKRVRRLPIRSVE